MSLVWSMLLSSAGTGRILCLHGSGGSGASLLAKLAPLLAEAPAWQFDAIDAPSGTGMWWTYPVGQRSYTASSYEGAEESIKLVEAAIAAGGYCGLLGFSQGAMLAAIIAARSAMADGPPLKLAICLSGALPKPYEGLLEQLRTAPDTVRGAVRTLHCLCRHDGINPPELGEQVATYFAASQILWHQDGHNVPAAAGLCDVAAFLEESAQATRLDAGDESD